MTAVRRIIVFFSLLDSCLQAGIDPHKWLTTTLEILLDNIEFIFQSTGYSLKAQL
jgi:hypothetical protein